MEKESINNNTGILLSVIIPVYNTEKYIEQCVTSIINQIDESVEIILVDDGSKDESADICKKLSLIDSRIKYFHQTNLGVSVARNIGIEKARGKYIQFTDSDDYWLDGKYKLLKESLLEKYDLIYVTGRRFLYENTIIKDSYRRIHLKKDNKYIDLMQEMGVGGVGKHFFLRDSINEHKVRFKPGIMIAEDADFNLEFSKHMEKVKIVDDIIYVYRVGRLGSAMNSQSFKARISRLDLVIQRKKQWLETNDDMDRKILTIFADGFFNGYMHQFAEDSEEEKRLLISKLEQHGIIDYLQDEKKWIRLINKYGYEAAILKEHSSIMRKHRIKQRIKECLASIK